MKGTTCERENSVLGGIRSGTWTTEIRAHARECPVCSDLALVDQFLQNEAALTAPAALPRPSLVWWRAQIALKARALRQATRPVRAVQVMAYVTSAIALIWLVITSATGQLWLAEFLSRLQHALGEPGSIAITGLVGCLVCMLLGSAFVAWDEY
jgi:hypothetical protein